MSFINNIRILDSNIIINSLILSKYYSINEYFIEFKQQKLIKICTKNFVFSPFKHNKFSKYYLFYKKNFFKNYLLVFCSFSYAKIFLKVGLGFRKKYSKKHNILLLNVVRRKIVYFRPPINSFFLMVKRRSLFVFANSKRKLFYYIIKFKSMRKETVYKYKGIFTCVRLRMYKRITKTILFARRIKFKRMKLKLNKKQKLKK